MSDTVEIPVALFERAASSLAGRPVCVRFQPTEVEGAVGQAYNLNGDAIIDVDDRKLQDTPSHLMSVYLHEVAHCANFQDIPLTHTIGAPGSIKGHRDNPLTKTLEYIDHEVKADNQAAVWLSWAERRYREWGDDSMPKIQRQLLSLECFIKPELEQYIAESVRKAVAARFSGVYSGTKTVSNRTGGPYDIVDNGDGTVSTILRTK